MRREILAFVALGPLPSSEDAVEASVERHQSFLARIVPPVTVEEAEHLMAAFGTDECFGLAWTLLHLIETAPGPLILDPPGDSANEWVRLIWERSRRAHGP